MAEQKKRGRPPKKEAEKKKRKPERTAEQKKATDAMLQFAAEYIIDWNGTRAAERAGYKGDDNTLAVTANRLLRNNKVIAEIDRLLSSRKERRAERRARVIDELEKIAFDDLETDVYRDKEGEIIGVSRKDRVKALELLGKTEALFTDRVEQTGPIDINVNFNPKGI